MGNTFQQKSSLLVKNWTKQSSNTYRNKITQELIDQYVNEYQTQEEMIINHKQLMGRANFNHPNIIKLIYFVQKQKGCCVGKEYGHKVFVQHQNIQLREYFQKDGQGRKIQCFCCPLVNAFSVLAEKYGFFKVKEEMVFLASQTKWHKSDKKTVKVWINSKPQINKPQFECKQQQMCESLYKILQKLTNKGICNKLPQPQPQINKMNTLVQQIYKIHNNILIKQIDRRKKVSSTYTVPTMVKVNQSTQDTLVFKNKNINNFICLNPTDRNLHKNTEIHSNDLQTMKKIGSSNTTKKLVTIQNKTKQVPFPFYKPPNKVNFAYNDLFSTPKQNKIIPPSLNMSSPNLIFSQQKKAETNQINKSRKLQRLTVNIMVQQQQKTSMNQISQPSQQNLKRKLQQIIQSSNHIASSPFLIDVNQPYIPQKSQEIPIRNLQTQPIVTNHQNILGEQVRSFEIQNEIQPQNRFFADPSKIPLSESLQDSAEANDQSYKDKQKVDKYLTAMQLQMAYQGDQSNQVQPIPKFGSIGIKPPILHHTLSNFSIENTKKLQKQKQEVASYYQISRTNSQYSKLDNNYNKYLQKFNQVVNPTMSPRSKFSTSSKNPPFQSLPSHSSQANQQYPPIYNHKTHNQYASLTMEESINRRKSKPIQEIKVNTVNTMKDGEIQSLYNQSEISQRENKAKIIERIENTEKIIRENRKKLQKLQLQKDLQRQKQIIKKEMQTLLKNNLMADQSNRIKEKVKHKKATFAQLKAQASKILQDFSF